MATAGIRDTTKRTDTVGDTTEARSGESHRGGLGDIPARVLVLPMHRIVPLAMIGRHSTETNDRVTITCLLLRRRRRLQCLNSMRRNHTALRHVTITHKGEVTRLHNLQCRRRHRRRHRCQCQCNIAAQSNTESNQSFDCKFHLLRRNRQSHSHQNRSLPSQNTMPISQGCHHLRQSRVVTQS